MSLTTMGIIGVSVLSCTCSFFWGVLFGRESILKQQRTYDPDQF